MSHKDKQKFLYPVHPYRGHPTEKALLFNKNLQIFAKKVEFIANLCSSGKLTPADAYHQIESLWKELHRIKKAIF